MALNLVTGGCGFIGTHLARLLRDRGDSVRVLDLRQPVDRIESVEYLQGSITDARKVCDAATGCRRVFHLAALSGLWWRDKRAFLSVNRDGTRHVLDAARLAGVETVVHTSTESVLIAMGRGRRPQKIDEQTQCTLDEMAGAYCRGKFLAEQEARHAASEGRRVIIVNPTVPAGPGDHWITPPTRMMLGFLNGAYPAYLDSTLNLADARDIAWGHWLAAESGRSAQRYILGAHDIGIGRLLELLSELSGRSLVRRRAPYPVALAASAASELVADWITRRPPAAPLAGVRLASVPVTFDNSETRAGLGWTPRPLAETLRDAITDYRGRGLI
jgi:dihydroflavonol-4-reductase